MREVRRQRQRDANLHRAAAMHRARRQWEREHAAEEKPFRPLPGIRAGRQELYIGCSGWFYWHWRDHLYANVPGSQWFSRYASRFRTVELNAPFYSWPTLMTVQSWLRQAARRRFVYTVKVSELITHTRRFVGTRRLVRDFGLIADLLGPRMGCFLFQLPPSFRYTPARLRRIVSQLDPLRRNVVEFRHSSWWRQDVFDALADVGAIFCCVSAPRLPGRLVQTAAEDIYVRFHGTKRWYRHEYSRQELSRWVEQIKASGARRVWAYFNNDRDGHAIRNAGTLIRLLRRS
jgi:uncharacterized protein YecE (DUF72 family)